MRFIKEEKGKIMEEFESVNDLYKRVKPALKAKRSELISCKLEYIKEEDIFTFLSVNKWSKDKGLTISEVVDDILHIDNNLLDDYVKQKWVNEEVEII